MSNISRIQKLGFVFRLFFLILLVSAPILEVSYWTFLNNLPEPIKSGGLPISVSQELSVKVRFLAFLVSLIPMSVDIAGLWTLAKLFTLYEKGKIFTSDNVKCFRRLGYILVLWSFSGAIRDMLLVGILTFPSPPEHPPEPYSLAIDVTALIIGGMVLVISWVMDEGRKLEAEQALTI